MSAVPAVVRFVQEIRNKPIEDMISPLVEAPSETTLSKILGVLRDREVYEVFLPEGPRCGMVSERELLKAANVATTKVSAVVTHIPVLRKDALAGEAARLMSDYRVRAVPISDGHKMIGQANCTTLLKELSEKIGIDLRITSLATTSPVTVEETTSVTKVRDLLVRRRIDHLPVTSGKRVAGIVTSSNVISVLHAPERVGSKSMQPQTKGTLDFPVGDVMDTNPLTRR
jgi:CBS domain-containing protein